MAVVRVGIELDCKVDDLECPSTFPALPIFSVMWTDSSESKTALESQSASAQDLATVLHFVGRGLAPSAHKLDSVIPLIRKFIAADDGLLLLKIARNAFHKGPAGVQPSAVEILGDVFDDVGASSPQSSSGTSVADLEATLDDVYEFLTDPVDGMPYILERCSASDVMTPVHGLIPLLE